MDGFGRHDDGDDVVWFFFYTLLLWKGVLCLCKLFFVLFVGGQLQSPVLFCGKEMGDCGFVCSGHDKTMASLHRLLIHSFCFLLMSHSISWS